ncbi:hypothetical protein AXA44_25050 [Rhodococcus sp. SC4]|nr:hypothetical protein AXA44_25050 [Rhodococcus sp. SC4]
MIEPPDRERELAYTRGCLRVSEGEVFRTPTTALDDVLDKPEQFSNEHLGSDVISGGAAP